jgi:nitrogen fixation protein NifU and related proteins
MSELRQLYQELILDHSRHPRNCRDLPHPNRRGRGYNPLCGDEIDLQLAVDHGVIADVGFHGTGCAISQAAASTMTEAIKGVSIERARELAEQFRRLVTDAASQQTASLGKLAAFAGLVGFPTRVKCATLAWHTLLAALAEQEAETTTEQMP